jgi:hypothetical protein
MALIAQMSEGEVAEARARFGRARPFPHLVFENFLAPGAAAELSGFPDEAWPHWRRFGDAYQRGKRVCPDIEAMPGAYASLIREASAPTFLQRLEAITGIAKLLPDPYLDGGGLHVSGPGGVLVPHTDFHLYPRLDLYRSLNLLIYLNEDWRDEDGGALELFAKGSQAPEASVTPAFGRAVLFRTDDSSVHGFTRPVAARRERRSVALYYYTARETGHFSGDTSTHWRRRRHLLYDGLIFASRALAKLARMLDPQARPNPHP